MPIVGVVELAIQVFFAVHAIKTGRHGWIFIILFFPVVGSLVYFFVEYLPELQYEAKIRKSRNVSSPANIKQLQRNLEISDTIQNKINLAEAFFQNGQYHESINLLETCLVGPYSNDRHIIEGLIYSYFFVGNFEKTLYLLSALEENISGKISHNLKIFKARALEELGENDMALEEYESILNTFSGEEARCRYAQLLKKCGQINKSQEIFEQILKNARLAPRHYKKMQKIWVDIAKEELKDIA